MSSSTTTYRYDYVPPLTGYKLMKSLKNKRELECQLYCKGKQMIPKQLPKAKNSEWTGIGPMGLLLDPRLIPFDATADNIDQDTINTTNGICIEDKKKSEFLEIVRKCYPDIYERWYNWPKYKWQKDIERNRTRYQIDYTQKEQLPDEVGHIDTKYKQLENIMEETLPLDCREDYKPFNILFFGPPDIQRYEYDYGPYLLNPEPPKVTEYMDKISRTGCVITQNKLHQHQKCITTCIHKLTDQCLDMS